MTRCRRSMMPLGLLTKVGLPARATLGFEVHNHCHDAYGRLQKANRIGNVKDEAGSCCRCDATGIRQNVETTSSDCCSAVEVPPSFSVGDISVTEDTGLAGTLFKAAPASSDSSVGFLTSNVNAAPRARWPLLPNKVLALSLALCPASGMSQSTKTYSYDALGRLVEAADGVGSKSVYGFDAANNRSNVKSVRQFERTYEAEALSHQVGFAEPSSWAANVSTPTGALVYGPYVSDTPVGSHVATFRTLVDVVNASDGTVLYVDVNDATTWEVVAGRQIKRSDWVAPWAYQVFELPFEWPAARAGHQIEIRVWYQGNAHVRVDKVGYYTLSMAPPPPAPSFSVNDVSVTEAQTATFTVTKAGATTSSYSVNYGTANGTAISGTNYNATSGTLTFAASETSKTVSVQTLNDGAIQTSKSFNLNLSAPTGGATLADGSGTASVAEMGEIILRAGQSIASPDGRFLLLMQYDGNLVLYGPDGPMWLTGTHGGNDRWMIMQADGNLVVYNGANQPLWGTWTQGNPGARLFVQNDGNLVIYNTSNAVLWHANTYYVAPSLSVSDASATEGGVLSFTVTRSKPTTATYSVNFATANGAALSGSDFQGTGGTLTFAPGENTKSVNVSTIDDSVEEDAEAMTINLSAPTGGAAIGDAQAVGTIADDDFAPPEQCYDEGGRLIPCS